MERIYIHNLIVHTGPNLLHGNEVKHKNSIFSINLFVILQNWSFRNHLKKILLPGKKINEVQKIYIKTPC